MTRLVHLYRKRWRRDRGDYEPRIRPTVNSGGRTRYDPNSDYLSRIHIRTPFVNYRKRGGPTRSAWTEHQVPAVLRQYLNISFYSRVENLSDTTDRTETQTNSMYILSEMEILKEKERKRGEIGQNLSTQDIENLASRAAFFER